MEFRKTIGLKELSVLKFLLLMFAAIYGANARADQCSGRVLGIFVNNTGNLYIQASYRNEWTQICNVTSTWKGISPDLCKQWSSLVTALRVTQEPVVVYYSETMACNAIPYYTDAPAPVYVMIAVN